MLQTHRGSNDQDRVADQMNTIMQITVKVTT